MMRRVITGLLVLSAALLAVLPAASASAGAPVLGAKAAFPSGKGFGTVKPKVVYLGGDPTGYFSKLTWQHWGARRALGLGQGWCPGKSVAGGHHCPAALHASNLGACHGRLAYRTVVFNFKNNGTWIFGSRYNVCSNA